MHMETGSSKCNALHEGVLSDNGWPDSNYWKCINLPKYSKTKLMYCKILMEFDYDLGVENKMI